MHQFIHQLQRRNSFALTRTCRPVWVKDNMRITSVKDSVIDHKI